MRAKLICRGSHWSPRPPRGASAEMNLACRALKEEPLFPNTMQNISRIPDAVYGMRCC